MHQVYDAKYCSLHVRVSNRAALTMYADVLKYETIDVENEYYADKEDAYDMVNFFDQSVREEVTAECKAKHQKRRNEKGLVGAVTRPGVSLDRSRIVDIGGHKMGGAAEAQENEESKDTTATSEATPPDEGEKTKKKKTKKKK